MPNKIAISSGHGKYVQGASGVLNEVTEARKIVDRVIELLKSAGVTAVGFHDNTSTSVSQNLNTIVNYHNSRSRDLDVSVHFNAYQTTTKPMGTEVLYVTQSGLAANVSLAIANAGSFINRGAKYRSDLFFLNSTHEPAILLETCFVDSSTDAELYRDHFDSICTAIAESISGEDYEEGPPPVEPPGVVDPPPLTGENRVNIQSVRKGDVTVYINNNLIVGHKDCEHVLNLTITLEGDVVLGINGQDFHNHPPFEDSEIQENHKEIQATVFGGAADNEFSAYPPYDSQGRGPYLNDTDLYVALPYSWDPNLFPDNVPKVRVYCGELSGVGRIADKGPWTTDDEDYVMGSARPMAETCYAEGSPLPSGPNKGKVPSNAAGIDLSPALAEMIGVDGKGYVDWEFVEEA